jgi:hypothetical protein
MAAEHCDTATVTFNWADKEVSYQPDALVWVRLEHANRALDVRSNHLLGLFTEGSTELDDNNTAKAAGGERRMLLAPRQSTIRGGA